MTDPVTLIEKELKVQREVGAPTDSACSAGAFLILNELTRDGWRIVRTDPNTEPGERPIVLEEWTP